MSALKICVEARLENATPGGGQQVLIGLASGLSRLEDGDEEYLFLVREPGGEWLLPYLKGPCRAVLAPALFVAPQSRLRDLMKKVAPLRRAVIGARKLLAGVSAVRPVEMPAFDPRPKQLGAEVMHFPFQYAYPTGLPSIYHPHDLQHLHLPQFFKPHEIRGREAVYGHFCRTSSLVAVTSTWVKNDVMAHYDVAAERVAVIPLAPVLDYYPIPTEEDLRAASSRLRLPERFAFYPAQTWPHKNHVGLLRAMKDIRERTGVSIPFIFSGHQNANFAAIEKVVREERLEDSARFVGFVTPSELQSLYRLATCVVVPTKFEAASFPLWEAFAAGVPAACSNVTSLPEQAGDAALIFDPDSPREMADCILRLWNDAELRRTLIARGKQRVAQFDWDKTVRTFRAQYRRLAGRPLGPADTALLSAGPIL